LPQLPATRHDSGEFIFQQDCHSALDTIVFLYLHQILTDF